jgi:general secretion pathway protein G
MTSGFVTVTAQKLGSPATRRKSQSGLTLVELIVAFTIMMVLTSMAVPLARYKVQRDKERDLERSLREMRTAIDKFKDDMDAQKIGPAKLDSDNYPESLKQLVEGIKATGSVDKKNKYLRRIPKDPMTNSYDWGLRSDRDDPTSQSWGGQNVFDVYTKSMDKARDGTSYGEW